MKTETKSSNWKTRAAFIVNHKWQWHTWTHNHGNSHAAIVEKAQELGATGYDCGNADHAEFSRANF